jgi:hypothetical protein
MAFFECRANNSSPAFPPNVTKVFDLGRFVSIESIDSYP